MIPRRLLAVVAATLMAAILPMSAPAGADEPLTVVSTDVTAYPDVRLLVAPPAPLGDQVLTEAAFHVNEGGEPRTVSRVEAIADDHLEVALAVDTSGSMAGAPLAAAKAAAHAFIGQLPAAVHVSVVGFGAVPTVVSARSTDRAAQASAVSGLVAHGQTALYDGLGLALAQLPPAVAGIRRVVVLVTDGRDTASVSSLETTANALVAGGIALFAVELGTGDGNSGPMTRLTAGSGRVALAADPAGVAGAFDGVARQLVRQYAVTYRSAARGAADVDIVLEAQGVKASARSRVELPPAPASDPAPDGNPAGAPPGDAAARGAWALPLGVGLCGAALLMLLLGTMASLGSRVPRAGGLATARPRSRGLSGVTDRAEVLGESVLRGRGGVASVSGALDAAGLNVRPGELFLAVIVLDLLMVALATALIGLLAGVLLFAIVPFVARLGIDVLARRRRRRFTDQLTETLQILAGTLRAGHGLSQGIETVSREAESPTAEEIRRVTVEIRLGRDLVEALSSLADRMESEDFRWVVQAIEIQRDIGGDLAEVLDSVASTIRDRTRIRRQVAALSAEGRMSAWVLMILPFGLGGIMAITNKAYLSPLFGSAKGFKLLAVGAVLLLAGGLWLRRIVRPIF